MTADDRRELNSPSSADAGHLPDATGPDGVRVVLRIEPAVARLKGVRSLGSAPAIITDPFGTYVDLRTLPGLVQKYVLRDRWVVQIEVDNGERYRVKARSRDEAIDCARRIHDGIAQDGVTFLRRFAG